MNTPATMAMRITEETYDIAVACLAAGFPRVNKKRVLGGYLVINHFYVTGGETTRKTNEPFVWRYVTPASELPSSASQHIGTFWFTKKEFKKRYAFKKSEKAGHFRKVVSK